MSQFGDTVTLVNRTKRTVLGAQWDGVHYKFDPGDTPGVPLAIAQAAYRQNPLHGMEDPLGDPEFHESLIGIKGAQEPFGNVTPIEQSDAGERLDRSKIPMTGKLRKMNAGGPTYFDAKIGTERVDLTDDAVAGKK